MGENLPASLEFGGWLKGPLSINRDCRTKSKVYDFKINRGESNRVQYLLSSFFESTKHCGVSNSFKDSSNIFEVDFEDSSNVFEVDSGDSSNVSEEYRHFQPM